MENYILVPIFVGKELSRGIDFRIKSTLKAKMDEVTSKAIKDLKIGELCLGSESEITEKDNDIQTRLLQEIRQKLFGRNVSARGLVMYVHDELWFFPYQMQLS